MSSQQTLITTHSVETPSGRISYASAGFGPVALFVHGVVLNKYLWRHQLAGLSDVRRCIAVDLLAHGDTEIGDDEMGPAVIVGPIGQFVFVGVTVIKEPPFPNDKAPCIGARRADVPADRPRSGQSPDGLDGETDMLSRGCFVDAVIGGPA